MIIDIQIDVSGAELTGADLSGANFSRAQPGGADRGELLRKSHNLLTAAFVRAKRSGVNLRRGVCDLVKLVETDTNVAGTYFDKANRANLSRANLSGTNLSKAKLSKADLSEAHLSEANLSGGDLKEADLSGTILNGADLKGADFYGANLNGVDLHGVDLRTVGFHRTHLSTADLGGAQLSGVNLRQVNLKWAKLRGADLSGAVLAHTDLAGADLGAANLSGAVLGWTIFSNVDLSSRKNLETIRHLGPSSVDIHTLQRSGSLPRVFLGGVGLPEMLIDNLPKLLEPPKFYSCFISYSSKDEDFASRLHAAMRKNGVPCWRAAEDMKIGAKMLDTFTEAIGQHDKVLLVLSEASIASEWVEDEVTKAFEEERRRGAVVLFPITIDDAVFTTKEAWAVKLRANRNIGDFRGWKDHDTYQKALERVLRDLRVAPH